MGWRVATPIPGIDVLQVYSDNTLGSGTLTVETTGSVAWTPNGGVKGTAVDIAFGNTEVVLGDGGTGTVIVERNTSGDLDTTKSTRIFCDERKCTLEKLKAIEEQIEIVNQAQRTGIGDEYLQRGKLDSLVAEQRRLERKYAAEIKQKQTFVSTEMAGT